MSMVRALVALGVVLLAMAPGCGGHSVSRDDDDNAGNAGAPPDVPPPGDDDGGYPRGGRNQGGVGAGGNSGGTFPTGGAAVTGGTFPTGGAAVTGGTFPVGGTAGVAVTGGTFPTGGTFTTGGTTGTGGRDPNCTGIRNNMPCILDGLICQDLACGLADSGVRACSCATNWACTACDYTGSWIYDPPPMIAPCPQGVADEVACTLERTICGPQPNGEYCACWNSPSDGLSWDCDSPPSSWPAL